jgi:hypothetical protein
MNTTARRLVTTLAGVGLAASAVATTGPAAFAGKPGNTTTQLSMTHGGTYQPLLGTHSFAVGYEVPVAPRSITSITCSLDGVPLADCGAAYDSTKKSVSYRAWVVEGAVEYVEQDFSVIVTTTKGTYSGTQTLTWLWS